MSNKLQLRKRISRLLSGVDDFTITDIVIFRLGDKKPWGSIKRGKYPDTNKRLDIIVDSPATAETYLKLRNHDKQGNIKRKN